MSISCPKQRTLGEELRKVTFSSRSVFLNPERAESKGRFGVMMLDHTSYLDSLQPYRLEPARLLCPWDFPGKNTGVGCHSLIEGIVVNGSPNIWEIGGN